MGHVEYLKTIALCVAAACVYGILQDQVTAHVCVEYFSVWHPPLFATRSPALLALGWGVVATWWVGALIGVSLALCARAGRAQKLAGAELVRPVAHLMLAVGAAALLAGVTGYALARAGVIHMTGWVAGEIPAARHARFLADLWAHNVAYLAGLVGGIVLCAGTVRRRRREGGHGTSF